MSMQKQNDRYCGLDGLRTIAAFGIIAVHVAKNGGFDFAGFWYRSVVCRMETFVNLFFILSAFSMCCGYYEKIKKNEISIDSFYKKRYIKIWPFFAILVLADMVYSWEGLSTLADAFADLTLAFAFLPNSSISIIGVGWTLGVIFAFYMLFPFYVFCIWNKRRAWFCFFVSIVFDILKDFFFKNGDSYFLCNILRWSPYFMAGGLAFLYKEQLQVIVNKDKHIWLIVSTMFLVSWFVIPDRVYGIDLFTAKTIITSICWIAYAISAESKLLGSSFCRFISGISFEIYLIHMFVYRVIEKIGLFEVLGTEYTLAYFADFAIVSLGAVFTVVVLKNISNCIKLRG